MLNKKQKTQIDKQIYTYESGEGPNVLTIPLGEKNFKLTVDKFVASPAVMNAGMHVLTHLVARPDIVKNKTVIDMGTGSGVLGIACAILGAKKVYMLDIDKNAVNNARKNVNALRLGDICKIYESDLFENFPEGELVDVQIFNHPFFAEEPIKNKPWSRMMLGGTELIGKYFKDAPKFSTEDTLYILPWLTTADNENGLDNNPGKRGIDHGYKAIEVFRQEAVTMGVQREDSEIYLLKRSV